MKQKLQKGDKIPFTQVANAVLVDPSLSFKAKGLYGYLYSKDEKYDFAAKRIAKDSSDGMDSVLSGLRELENAGYLGRKKLKNGRVVYTITIAKSAKPRLGSNPKREKPNQGIPQSGESPSISNIDKETNIDSKQTFLSEKKKRVREIQEMLIPYYEEKWEKYGDDHDALLSSLCFKLSRGEDTFTRAPKMIKDYLDYHPNEGWETKADFMATMKNLTKNLVEADVDTVSNRAWQSALERTENMDMATIRTVINSI